LLLRLPQLVFGMFALALVGKVPQGKVNVRRHGEEQALGLVIKGLSRLCHQDKHRIHRPIAVQRDGHCGGRARQSVDPNRSVFAQCRARRALAGQVLPTHATGGQRHHFSRVSGVPTDPRGLHPSQAHSRLTDVSEEHGLIRTLHDRLIASAQRCIQAFLALDARLGKHPGSDVLHHHHALRTIALLRRRQPPDLQVDPGAGSIALGDAAIHRIRTLAPLMTRARPRRSRSLSVSDTSDAHVMVRIRSKVRPTMSTNCWLMRPHSRLSRSMVAMPTKGKEKNCSISRSVRWRCTHSRHWCV
jgi:hypothetical protein